MESRDNLKAYQRWVLWRVLGCLLLVAVISSLFFRDAVLGLLWGGSFGVLVFNQKMKWAAAFAQRPFSQAKATLHFFYTYTAYGVAIAVAIKFDTVNLASTMIGILSVYLVLLLKEIYEYHSNRIKRKNTHEYPDTGSQ